MVEYNVERTVLAEALKITPGKVINIIMKSLQRLFRFFLIIPRDLVHSKTYPIYYPSFRGN